MNILLINLRRAHTRRDRMMSQLLSLGLTFQVIEAIDGTSLRAEDLSHFIHYATNALTGPEYGCLLSHVRCWREVVESGLDSVLILEDDMHFGREFKDFLAGISVPLDEPCIIKTETVHATVSVSYPPKQTVGKRLVYRLLTPHGGTGAYIINARCAKYLLDNYHRMRWPVDIEMFFDSRRSFSGCVAIYQVIPAPNIQDWALPSGQRELPFDSAIEGQRIEPKWMPTTFNGRLKEAIKQCFRPLYRMYLSNGFLFPFQRRIKVSYE